MEQEFNFEEDLSNFTDDTNFSSVLVSKSPLLADAIDGFVDDPSLPELARLDEFIKHLEQDLMNNDYEIRTIQDLRRDEPATSFPSSSSRLTQNCSSSETDASQDETDREEPLEEDYDITEELRDDEHRLRYYHECLQSPNIVDATFTSGIKAPYQTPSVVHGSKQYQQDILDTPLRVDEMLAAIHARGYTSDLRGSIPTKDDYDFIEHTSGKSAHCKSNNKRLVRPTSFFESALESDGDGESSPGKSNIHRNTSSSGLWDTTTDSLFSGFEFTPSISNGPSGSKRLQREEFTIDSLKRNWEMEDEISDAEDDEGGFILPDRSSPVVGVFPKIEKARSVDEDQENQLANRLSVSIPPPFDSQNKTYSPEKPKFAKKANTSVVEAAATASFHIPTSDTKDLRLNGDFSVWSNGKMLNPIFLHREYVGLTPSAVTHVVSGGKLVPISTAMNEYSGVNNGVNNLDAQFNAAKSGAPSSASMTNYENVTTVLPVGDNSNLANGNTSGSRGFYMLHTVECVIRPDIELKSVMAIVVKLAKHVKCKCILQKRSHAILFQSTSSNNSIPTDNTDAKGNAGKEWDQLDIQICVNRELRQRVVLMQFMKRSGIFGSAGLGMIATQLAGPLEYVPLSKCQSTRKLVSTFKKEMINQELTLSCLYTIPMDKVCALPKGLDKHFLAQLHSLCRENMLQKLTNDYKGMDEHMKDQAMQNKIFLETIEPILKQYNIPLPIAWSKKRVGTKALEEQVKQEQTIVENMSSEAIINNLQDFDRQFLTSPDRKKSKYQLSYFQSNDVPSTPERQTPEMSVTTPKTTASTASGTSAGSNSSGKGNGDISFQTVSLHSPTSSPMIRKYRSDIESSTDENMDGMTLCLMMLDMCYQNLQQSCDLEYEQRVQQRNSSTILLIEDMIAYKKEILQSIINFPDIMNSATMKSFQQTFQGWRVTKESTILEEKKKESEAAAAQAQAQIANTNAKISTWFQGFGAKLGISAASNNTAPVSSSAKDLRTRTSPTCSPGSDEGDNIKLSPKKREVPFRLSSSIVLYYCTGLIGNIPGVTYITQRHICFTSSVLGFNAKREVFALDHLTDISLLSSETSSGSNAGDSKSDTSSGGGLFASNTLKFSFYFGLKDVTITPVAIDCMRVKSMIELIQQQFSSSV